MHIVRFRPVSIEGMIFRMMSLVNRAINNRDMVNRHHANANKTLWTLFVIKSTLFMDGAESQRSGELLR